MNSVISVGSFVKLIPTRVGPYRYMRNMVAQVKEFDASKRAVLDTTLSGFRAWSVADLVKVRAPRAPKAPKAKKVVKAKKAPKSKKVVA